MAMTEAEARTKRCCGPSGCGSRTPPDYPDNYSGPPLPSGKRHCIGSACMAWQWRDATYIRERELWSKSKGERVHSAFSDDADWRPVHDKDKGEPPPALGYCGLASPAP